MVNSRLKVLSFVIEFSALKMRGIEESIYSLLTVLYMYVLYSNVGYRSSSSSISRAFADLASHCSDRTVLFL